MTIIHWIHVFFITILTKFSDDVLIFRWCYEFLSGSVESKGTCKG